MDPLDAGTSEELLVRDALSGELDPVAALLGGEVYGAFRELAGMGVSTGPGRGGLRWLPSALW